MIPFYQLIGSFLIFWRSTGYVIFIFAGSEIDFFFSFRGIFIDDVGSIKLKNEIVVTSYNCYVIS